MSLLPDHESYITYKNSVNNITLTNLINVLCSYKLCTGVESEIAKTSSTSHIIPHNIKHPSTISNKPDIYFRPDLLHVLVKHEQKYKICQKYIISCISKGKIISKRQSIISSILAKLNADSKPLSEHLPVYIFRIESNELKGKVNKLQQELSKSSLKVSAKLRI